VFFKSTEERGKGYTLFVNPHLLTASPNIVAEFSLDEFTWLWEVYNRENHAALAERKRQQKLWKEQGRAPKTFPDFQLPPQVTLVKGATWEDSCLITPPQSFQNGRLSFDDEDEIPPSQEIRGGFVLRQSWNFGSREFHLLTLALLSVCSDGVWIFWSRQNKEACMMRLRVEIQNVPRIR